jgi:hypothetical protein
MNDNQLGRHVREMEETSTRHIKKNKTNMYVLQLFALRGLLVANETGKLYSESSLSNLNM